MTYKVKDETGRRYNRLLVISRAENNYDGCAMWLCLCNCGNEAVVNGKNLRNGDTQSCGCFKRDRISETHTKDMTGKVFSKLTVLSREGNLYGQAAWLCLCECGNKKVIAGASLRTGNTKSCGCLHRFPDGESAFNELFGRMQRSANRRGYIWELTREQVRILTSQNCYYCGAAPRRAIHKGHGKYTCNGIDRKDNNVGYIESNCIPCCKQCNLAKHTNSAQDFIAWARRVIDTANRVEQHARC